MTTLSGARFHKDVILFAVSLDVRHTASCRDMEKAIAERGVPEDHSTLNRLVGRYASRIVTAARRSKAPVVCSWRMDER